jgi:excisionase family DNA binding protein
MEHSTTDDMLLTTKQVADILQLGKTTIERWRRNKMENLPYVYVGKKIRYRLGDLRTWILEKKQTMQLKTEK